MDEYTGREIMVYDTICAAPGGNAENPWPSMLPETLVQEFAPMHQDHFIYFFAETP